MTLDGLSESADRRSLTVSVVIPTYSLERWDLLSLAVTSATNQTRAPCEVIVTVDRNEDLFERCQKELAQPGDSSRSTPAVRVLIDTFADRSNESQAHVRAHGTSRRFGGGSARNAALEVAIGDVVAFLDDDAEAQPGWLAHLLAPYADDDVIAVGGPPLPRYETHRPQWMPYEFDWVFGCAYYGLPESLAPLRHLIGANMSVRRTALDTVGGFHSVDFDDMDMCHRLAHAFPSSRILYQPSAVVRHFVSAERVSWHYFWRRCFYVNKYKVQAFSDMGRAANLVSERAFVTRMITHGLVRYLRELLTGKPMGCVRAAVAVCGIALAAFGNLAGRVVLARRRFPTGQSPT